MNMGTQHHFQFSVTTAKDFFFFQKQKEKCLNMEMI